MNKACILLSFFILSCGSSIDDQEPDSCRLLEPGPRRIDAELAFGDPSRCVISVMNFPTETDDRGLETISSDLCQVVRRELDEETCLTSNRVECIDGSWVDVDLVLKDNEASGTVTMGFDDSIVCSYEVVYHD